MRLLRQIHLAQKLLVAHVRFEIPQERVALNSVERYIFLAVRSIKPTESLINLAAICVYFGYCVSRIRRV